MKQQALEIRNIFMFILTLWATWAASPFSNASFIVYIFLEMSRQTIASSK